MATRAVNNSIGKLYAGLNERERVRMLARLSREHNREEMNRLRDATPPEHADAYNRALGMLRVLNGNLLDWIALFRTAMERDRFRLQVFAREATQKALNEVLRMDVWKLVSYPVTESEYRALVKRERAALTSLDDYARYLADTIDLTEDETRLPPDLTALLQSLPPELEREGVDRDYWREKRTPEEQAEAERLLGEDHERADKIAAQIRAVIDAAIERRELPKPKRLDGEPALPWGVLHDWGEGTTPETYTPYGPGYNVPALELFGGDLHDTWDVRPDSEADAVRARRADILDAVRRLSGIPHTEPDPIRSLDPPLTVAAHKKAREHVDRLDKQWRANDPLVELVLDAAKTHAVLRAQIEAIATATEILQRDDFGGEDPLWPETRAHLEAAQAEAARIEETWEMAHIGDMGPALRKAMGLDPDYWGSLTDDGFEPAPLPTEETAATDLEEMLRLIRDWGERS